MQTVQNIRDQFKEKFLNKDFTGNTVEIIGATFLSDQSEIFGSPNPEWYERELKWYESISLNVNDISGEIPTIWKHVATPDGMINSNYGWCIWSEENGRQYCNVLQKLKEDPNSRQATMIYNRPSMHEDWNKDGRRDFMCTYANQFFIRDGKLISHYIMRSNDSVFGYRGDVHWAREVQKRLAKDLSIEVGDLIWTASSLHVYDRHYYMLDHYAKTGEISISKKDYAKLYPDSKYV